MAKKVFNMEGGLHSANAFTAFEARAYGSCVASPTSLKVVPASGMTVRVSVGDGIIDGQTPRRVQIDAVENITLTPASTSYARKDLIVAYIDSSVQPTTSVVDNTNNVLKFVAVNGTPSAVPATPSSGEIQAKIGAGNQYMILAEINVAQSAVSILENAISDKRNIITVVPVESLSGKITGSQIDSSTIGADNINFATLDFGVYQAENTTESRPANGEYLNLAQNGAKITINVNKSARVLISSVVGIRSDSDFEFKPLIFIDNQLVKTLSLGASVGNASGRRVQRTVQGVFSLSAGTHTISAGVSTSSGTNVIISIGDASVSVVSVAS